MILPFGIVYQTPPDVCAGIPELVRGVVENIAGCKLVRCGMTGFGASSLDYELQFDVHTEELRTVFVAQSAVAIAILRAFNDAGIQFAYPTQTSFTAAPDGMLIMPYAGATDQDDRLTRT